MPSSWETIWGFNTKQFRVEYSVTEDWDTDLSWDDDGSVRRGLDSGNLVSFQARVCVYYKDHMVGRDYLGGCIYKNAREFIDHRGRKHGGRDGAGYGSYFSDMVSASIREARQYISQLQDIRLRPDIHA